MAMEVTRSKGIDIITLDGRFDAHLIPTLNSWLDGVKGEPSPQIIVNMEEVNFVDSAGLSALVRIMKRSRQHGGNLAIYGLRQPVRIIFELTRLDQAFDIYDSEESAVAAIKQPEQILS